MQTFSNARARVRWTALGIFALALAIRVVHVLEIRRAPFFSLLMGDSLAYDQWAQRIAAGDWIGRDVFYQAPLYPYFLGLLYSTVGRDLAVVRLVQAAVGAFSCVLLFDAGRRLISERAGIVAGVMLALWAPAIFFDGLIQKSVLDVFLVCVLIWLLSIASSGGSWVPFAIGAALGALSLTRENAIVFVAVVAIWTLTRPQPWRRLALIAAGLAMLLGPVVVRNYAVAGGFYVTTSQFGPNFYIGNNPRADGTYASLRFGRGAPEYERQDATELAERATGRPLSPAEVSQYWTQQAFEFIRNRPLDWLRLTGRKFVLLWNATEMVDTESQETHAEWSWPLRVLSRLTHFGVLVPLALFGLVSMWRDPEASRLLLALMLSYAASVLAFYVFARYRYPLVPLLILFAAAGLVNAPATLRSTSGRGVLVAAVIAVAVLANWPVIPHDWQRAVTENNMAVALQAQGRYGEARAHYEKAIALRPDYAPALNNMATALRAAGRIDEAVATYQRALALRADYPEAEYNLGNALTDAGRRTEAVEHFQRALRSIPASADVHNNLGIALAGQGRIDDAIAQFREAVRADPQSAKAHRNLGDSLLTRGAVEEGLIEMREATRLAPADGSFHYDFGSALLEAGRTQEAIVELREAVERLPRSPDAHNNLGIALGSEGHLDEAIEQFRAAIAVNPAFADARRNLEMALAARRR